MILKELVELRSVFSLYLPTRVKSRSSRFTCILYAGLPKRGFQLLVGVRLIRGCLYPSIYGRLWLTQHNSKLTHPNKLSEAQIGSRRKQLLKEIGLRVIKLFIEFCIHIYIHMLSQ